MQSTVTFVGMGLNDENGLTLEGINEAQEAHAVFGEQYTSPMAQLNVEKLVKRLGKPIVWLTRRDLEDDSGRKIVEASGKGKVVFLVPGDPIVATTHVSLRLILARQHVPTRIVHAPSIISAIIGSTGLQNYKFGRSITMPFQLPVPQSILDGLMDNLNRGLHTLIFLDPALTETTTATAAGLTIPETVGRLINVREEFSDQIGIGAARVGSKNELVKAGKMKYLVNFDFGSLPHILVVPGKLHFMEVEALEMFCGLTKNDLEI